MYIYSWYLNVIGKSYNYYRSTMKIARLYILNLWYPETIVMSSGLGLASHAVLPGTELGSRLDSAHLPRCPDAAAVPGAHALRFTAESQRLGPFTNFLGRIFWESTRVYDMGCSPGKISSKWWDFWISPPTTSKWPQFVVWEVSNFLDWIFDGKIGFNKPLAWRGYTGAHWGFQNSFLMRPVGHPSVWMKLQTCLIANAMFHPACMGYFFFWMGNGKHILKCKHLSLRPN
jgi:hypothetical protein